MKELFFFHDADVGRRSADPVPKGPDRGIETFSVASNEGEMPSDIGLSSAATGDGVLAGAGMRERSQPGLREASVATEHASQSKSRFLAAASHDLRQPLQAICFLHGLLKERVADPKAQATLAKLDYAVDYMTGLLDTLLDIDQLEDGRITPEFTGFALSSLLDRVAGAFASVAAARGLELRWVPSSISIHSDARLLARMIGNLLSNAIKYTDHGKVLLGCRRRGNTLRIEVWDTGIGIPSESFDATFDEFSRTDDTGGTKFGPGLGLYIVRRFGELLGHKIEMHSKPGRGTMFAIVVPGVEFDAQTPKVNRPKDKAQSEPTILLVEDDAAQLVTLRTLLEQEGYRVVAARNGNEALSQLGTSLVDCPNLVIVDYNLPDETPSVDVIFQVRDKFKNQVPGLIVTAQRPVGDLVSSNGIVIIAKPVTPASLISEIGALMESAFPGLHRIGPSLEQAAALSSATVADRDIAIVNGESAIRDACKAMLEAERYTVETFGSAEAFLSDARHAYFRCLIVDLTLPGLDGLQLQRRLRSEHVSPPIIFVTDQSDLPTAVRAMQEGAADFLQKPVHAETLRESIARALRHGEQAVIDRIEREKIAARIATLTERERQVMARMLAGQLNKNIAAELGISRRTTEHHRQSVFRKMGTKSLAMLVRMCGVA
jgi:two-component system CheB/CheR fusion protein